MAEDMRRDVAQASAHLARWRELGNPSTATERREWRGQIFEWQTPPVGYVCEGCGAPVVGDPNSLWVQIVDAGAMFTVRVR